MSFLWGEVLWFIAVLPMLFCAYLLLLRRRKEWGVRLSGLWVAKDALASSAGWQRHIPPIAFLAGLGALIIASARPMAIIALPIQQQKIVLAMDVSGSMRAEDVAPDRLTASQQAAKAFVAGLPHDVRVGVVSYGGTAHVVQPPTRNREDVVAAIDRMQLQPGTAIGNGVLVSLATILPDAGIDIAQMDHWQSGSRIPPIDAPMDVGAQMPESVAPGSYETALIVLLSDGQNTTGVDPLEAARLVADRGVRVFTVGFGTPNGANVTFGDLTIRVRLDEQTLREIAAITHGEYFYAATGPDLERAYATMGSRLALEKHETEISALFAAGAAMLLLAGSGLSVWWYGRVL